jgi:hypothetical protein
MRDTQFLSRHRYDDKWHVNELMTYSEPVTAPPSDLVGLAAAVTAATSSEEFLPALRHLHLLRAAIDALEPELIDAARHAGASWQALAPALGVASRQAAERRYLRLIPATTEQAGSTRDQRVQRVRDLRAGTRAVNGWANDNTADLRRLAAQITALDDLDPTSTEHIDRLNGALGATDAVALPELLAAVRQHLDNHPALARQIDTVTADTARVRHETQQHRDSRPGT